MTTEEQRRKAAIHHVVHEYANFVSSTEMVLTGKDIYGHYFKPPINTHISHAFYLNCRKLADFFQNKASREGDNIMAEHFISGYRARLKICDTWRVPINKQLAHTTYARATKPRNITRRAHKAMYKELRDAWHKFRKRIPKLYADEFVRKIKRRKAPYRNGQLSEFRFYDLD